MRRIAAVLLLTASLGGCGSQPIRPSGLQTSSIALPGIWPEKIATGRNGALWIADRYQGIERVDRNGRTQSFGTGEVTDLDADSDGAVWFTTTEWAGRIDRTGMTDVWRLFEPGFARAITADNGTAWLAVDGTPNKVERLLKTGPTTTALPTTRACVTTTGITRGPDGALWLTEQGCDQGPPDGIGRVTRDGRYTRWVLPTRHAGPTRITAGQDGAIWFTEQDGHRIGRITAAGAIKEFSLPDGLSPSDIVRGRDGALWFTTDVCLGRITTSGRIGTWPVPNAKRLVGIAAVRDGSFWIADDLGHALRHVRPALAAEDRACQPPAVSRRVGSTRAELIYRRVDVVDGDDFFTSPRVRIWRKGARR